VPRAARSAAVRVQADRYSWANCIEPVAAWERRRQHRAS
jgi:hypothetical protein